MPNPDSYISFSYGYSLGASGLGFYGPTFNSAIDSDDYNDSTFITNSSGTIQGPQLTNLKFVNESGVLFNGTVYHLRQLPNSHATIRIEITNATPIRVENPKLLVFDVLNPTRSVSGVRTFVAEIAHAGSGFTLDGTGSIYWTELKDNDITFNLSEKTENAVLHEWYVALSCTKNADSVNRSTAWGASLNLNYY